MAKQFCLQANRCYVEHPQRIRRFAELRTHPWVIAVCETVLGPDYRIAEAGLNVPGPGAPEQPWHGDFPSPEPASRHWPGGA